MATCFNHHLAYELVMPDPTSYPTFAFMITSFRADGSKCDDYRYTATWGSAYVYSLWLSRLANLPQPAGILDRTPGLMDVLNQFMRHPGYMVTTRTGRNHYPCVTGTVMVNEGNGLVSQTYAPQTQPLTYVYFIRPDPSAGWGFFDTFDDPPTPFEFAAGPAGWQQYAQLVNRDTHVLIANSNVVTLTPGILAPPIVTVIDYSTISISWTDNCRPNRTDISISEFETGPFDPDGYYNSPTNGETFFWIFDGYFYRWRFYRNWDNQTGPWTPPRDS